MVDLSLLEHDNRDGEEISDEEKCKVEVEHFSLMARKKKKEKYKFEFPEFDRAEFVRKAFLSAKLTYLAVGFAVPMAFISYFLALVKLFEVGFLVGFLGVFALKFVFLAFKINLTKVEKKNWVGAALTYLFAWFAFWLLIVNTF